MQSRKVRGRVWERSVYLCALCLSYEMILASLYPFTHSNRTPLSCWCLAVIAGWAALDLLSNPQANLPKLCKRFHAGVWGHFTFFLLSWPRKMQLHLLYPRRARVLNKALRAHLEIRASSALLLLQKQYFTGRQTGLGEFKCVVTPLHRLTNGYRALYLYTKVLARCVPQIS